MYRGDNHGWLFGWKNGYVFQAGPAVAMNWYGTSGTGSQASAGTRASDSDSMCGNAVLYDAVGGNILTVGGAPAYVGKCTFSYNINTLLCHFPQRLYASYYTLDPRPYLVFIIVPLRPSLTSMVRHLRHSQRPSNHYWRPSLAPHRDHPRLDELSTCLPQQRHPS